MGVCDVPVIHEVCNAAGDAAGAVITAPFDWLAQGMGGAAEWMFTSVWKVIDTTTFVDVTSGEYTKVYNIMFGVGVFVMLGFFMLQVIGGMIRRDPAALSRAALGLAKSILGSFVALALLGTALEISDQLSIGIVNAAGTNMNEMGDKVAVLAQGGHLKQFATPAELLGHPADDFVADFVGSTAGLRRLTVTKLERGHLEPLDGVATGDLGAAIDLDSTLEQALAVLLRDDKPMVGVKEGSQFVGVLTPDGIHRALRASLAESAQTSS